MRLDDGVRKHGFLRWYSRELTQAHLHLLLLLLCAVGLFATLELLGGPAPWTRHLGNAALLLICLGLGLWSLRRYVFLLMRAECVASQAVCQGCQTYGRLKLSDPQDRSEQVTVSCLKCAHRWQISDPGVESD